MRSSPASLCSHHHASVASKPALRAAGIEPLRWHDPRHTFANLLIAGGANVVFASRQLGHGSSDITLRVYSHLFDRAEQAKRTREMLETALGDVVRHHSVVMDTETA